MKIDERIKELERALLAIENRCKVYKPLVQFGSKADYTACLVGNEYFKLKRELEELKS